ncbi:MAG: site-specific tyrosine recombinase XerD [Bacteroidales bacterium]|nr:site-specific tyrosine recombinase XerD [Bacteroidales bacterium]
MPQNDVIKDYSTYLLLEKSFSKNTVEAYLRDLQKLDDFLSARGIALQDADYEALRDFVVEVQQHGLTPRSSARLISSIRCFYKYLYFYDKIKKDPGELLELPKLGIHLPEVLSIEEIDAILAQIDLSHPQGHRNRAIIETLYSCGLRVSEAVDLQLSNVYFDDEYIRVHGKGNKERIVPISKVALKYIRQWLEDRCHIEIKHGNEDVLFLNRRGAKLTRSMIFHLIKQYAEAAGIKKNISPHTFRHSFATHLMMGGADLRVVQELLGHESITTTEIYTHVDVSMLTDTIMKYHPRNKMRKASH